MDKLTLTMLDTSGIQNYIFNSNRLQENIGASELVYRATTLWAFDALNVAGFRHNVTVNSVKWTIEDGDIEKPNSDLQAEVIYTGGGNTLVLFRNLKDAQTFTRQITLQVLRQAPGLSLVASHLEFDPGSMSLTDARTRLLHDLAAHKQSRLPSAPSRGLSMTATCESTGLPAVQSMRLGDQEEFRLVSRETRAKLKMVIPANERLKDMLGSSNFPHDVDKLGRLEGEESYVAVVHADGNRMGRHLEETVAGCKTIPECKKALRAFSEKVNSAGLVAIRHVVRLVENAVEENCIPYETEKGRKYLPIRPLVFGGDDLTLLCNGQIGVSLAAAYLEAFEKAFQEKPVKGLEDVHARAGIAIVKMHYPFARAYQLSEQLLRSAKKFIRTENDSDCSALDWHYATGGLSGELEDVIRKREYEVKEGKLTMRPLRLDQGDQRSSGRYWRNGMENVLLTFKKDPYWSKRKNKVVGLREPLRKGGAEVRTYRRNFDIELLPELAGAGSRETGWQDGRCVYFDVVELFDHYLPLEKQEASA